MCDFPGKLRGLFQTKIVMIENCGNLLIPTTFWTNNFCSILNHPLMHISWRASSKSYKISPLHKSPKYEILWMSLNLTLHIWFLVSVLCIIENKRKLVYLLLHSFFSITFSFSFENTAWVLIIFFWKPPRYGPLSELNTDNMRM